MCTCPAGFEGAHCEHSQPTCADQPCFHSGKCWEKDNGRSYMCECPRGYTGLNCEKRVDKCTTLPCANGTTLPPHVSLRSSTSLFPLRPLFEFSQLEAELVGGGNNRNWWELGVYCPPCINTWGSSERRLVKIPLQPGSVDDRPTSLDFSPGVNTEGSSGSVVGRTISLGFLMEIFEAWEGL